MSNSPLVVMMMMCLLACVYTVDAVNGSSVCRKCHRTKTFYSVLFCCILAFYSTTSFPLYYIHLILFSHTEHLHSTEQRRVNSSYFCLKGPQQSSTYSHHSTNESLHSAGPNRQAAAEWKRQFFSRWLECTTMCSEMHGLPQSTTAPLLSQEFAGHHVSTQHVDTLIPTV